MSRRKIEPPPRVLVDNSEQLPWRFGWARPRLLEDGREPPRGHLHDGEVDKGSNVVGLLGGPFPIESASLETGDYSLADAPQGWIAVERKSEADMIGTLSVGHDRFEREIERLATFRRRIVVVEAPIERFLEVRRPGARVTAQSLIGSLLAFATRLNVPFFCMPNRDHAEYMAAWALRDAWREYLREQLKQEARA